MTKAFLDSSVIIAGVNSATGASHIILKLSKDGKIVASVSEIVLQEVVRNIKKKMPENVLIHFLKYLTQSNFRKVDFERESEILKYQGITDAKDTHVIAATFKSKADYLVTLDKKHLLKLERRDFPFKIVTPADFLKEKGLAANLNIL